MNKRQKKKNARNAPKWNYGNGIDFRPTTITIGGVTSMVRSVRLSRPPSQDKLFKLEDRTFVFTMKLTPERVAALKDLDDLLAEAIANKQFIGANRE